MQDNAVGKTPRYRGLAPIAEARDEGIPIMIASDNCEDVFYPFGDYNQISNFSIAVLAAQLDEKLWFDSISTIPANWMGAENNINKMQTFADENNVSMRPHSKTNKSPYWAKKQIDQGAIGICCAKLGEAEEMASGGVEGLSLIHI
mgnify:CR=1 FL=1